MIINSKTELANRWTRLGASIIDSFIHLVLMLPILSYTHFIDYIRDKESPPVELLLTIMVLGFLIYIATHYYFIKKNGQTIGKKLLKIRVENITGGVASFNLIVFKRYLFITAISSLPAIGVFLSVIDGLLIFRDNHQCWHDDFAQTRVVKYT
ncbi:MAG: RDD family protein [Thiotrichaceae bacterium]|nr:RDD family protein [Thiotrichaceae bacterium]